MGRQLEVPDTDQWMREHIDQNVREMTDLADLYAEGLAAERREAETREAELRAARDRVMHHMWHPSDDESNNGDPPRWSIEREHHLSFDSVTGEITNAGNTLPNEEVLFNPGTLVDTPENCGVTAIADTGLESSWNLSRSVNDIIDDKYKEMEKRVEEQDKTIADLKSIIENLQDIVYQQKLDKEAKNLVL